MRHYRANNQNRNKNKPIVYAVRGNHEDNCLNTMNVLLELAEQYHLSNDFLKQKTKDSSQNPAFLNELGEFQYKSDFNYNYNNINNIIKLCAVLNNQKVPIDIIKTRIYDNPDFLQAITPSNGGNWILNLEINDYHGVHLKQNMQ